MGASVSAAGDEIVEIVSRLTATHPVHMDLLPEGAWVSVFDLDPDVFLLWNVDDVEADTRILDTPDGKRWLKICRGGDGRVDAMLVALRAADRVVSEGGRLGRHLSVVR